MVHAMRVLLAVVMISTLANAQEKPIVEIGTNLGATIASNSIHTLTMSGIPGQGILGQPIIYASFFVGECMFFEPQIALSFLSEGSYNSAIYGLGARVGRLFNSSSKSSAFVAAAFASQITSVSTGPYHDSQSEFGLGGMVGYRFLIGKSVGLRVEGGCRRWFDGELNEYTFGIGFGGIVHHAE